MSNKSVKYLTDYTPTDYLVDTVDLTFILDDDKSVQVQSITHYIKNPKTTTRNLTLNGSAKLITIALNNDELQDSDYIKNDEQLTLKNLTDEFTLSVTTLLNPWENKSGVGLYADGDNLITQCEPEGFRTITYYQDRPDVLATFTTTIITKNPNYNALLSNGNKILEEFNVGSNDYINTGDSTANTLLNVVKWHDPFKKPSYLFALVMGNFAVLQDSFTTKSGRKVNLEIYAEKDVISRCHHAMQSVKTAFAWDEKRFNLEYDLDNYMIVASSNFNMGAMENKGLNIFNSKYIVADKNTATDADFILVEAVIGHEYFHNWTGNRVTCRNWFQLSLKEGLTVFRDHEFTADLHNRGLKRIQEVKLLRQSQFPEDAGALAHSVRPDSYIEMNNFYTVTIYEKGSEVVRMYQTILGKDGFNKGLALYLKRHDGSAATCEDFCQAMIDANNFDLKQFMLWYSQAGTPTVTVTTNYNKNTEEYKLTFTQSIPDTPNQTNKQPMLIPISVGLLYPEGHELVDVKPSFGRYVSHLDGVTLLLTEKTNVFTFSGIKEQPIPSILRGFSAPIKLEFAYSLEERYQLINHDSDEFIRFEHLQSIIQSKIIELYHKIIKKDLAPSHDPKFWSTCSDLLNNPNLAPEFRAVAFQLPAFSEMLTHIPDANPQALSLAITTFAKELGDNLFDSWMEIYNLHLSLDTVYDFNHFGKRSLKNIALFYILKALSTKLTNPTSLQLIETMILGQYHNAHNMTDSFAVLAAISDINVNIREQVLNEFYIKWQNNELVMDKWFAIQATSSLINVDMLNKLMVDKTFIATNPNKIYALLRNFTQNGLKFNSEDGYSFVADKIITIDRFNSHVASVLTQGFNTAVYLKHDYRKLAKAAMNRILNQENLSSAVYEIASKIMAGLKV